MKITQYPWGVIVGETAGQNEDHIKELSRIAAKSNGIWFGAIELDGQIAYTADWSIDDNGLGCTPVFTKHDPDAIRQRAPMPFNLPLFIGNRTWEGLGGWPDLPNGDSYGLVALGVKCYYIGYRIWCSPLPMKPTVIQPSVLNAHYVHSAYFSSDVYEHIWKPMLLHHGYTSEIDAVVELAKSEWEFLQEHRRVAEELFFRKALLTDVHRAFDINEAAGRATPSNHAVYVGYQARRSPGREWGKDKGRITRHIAQLMEQVDAKGKNLLDIGSRDGAYLEDLIELGFDAQGIEISIWSMQHARSVGRPVTYGDAHDLSRWGNKTFDVITQFHNLEHLHSPLVALKENYRVLKDDGLYMMVVPIEAEGLSLKGDHCFSMRSAQAVIQLAQAAGFECVDIRGAYKEFTGFFKKMGEK